jgi:membrane fusion protein (multidrug efflux system)
LFDKKVKHKIKNEQIIKVEMVSFSKVSTLLESIGTAVSNESSDITSTITQTVISVNFDDCEHVKKGKLLVQLNVDKKLAAKKQAEINFTEQKRELSRLETLKKKKIISEKDYDLQHTKFLDAQAKLDEINAEIKESSILAPFDGILGMRKVSVGALVTPGSIITTIDDIEKIKVDFSIPEKYLSMLEKKCKITAKNSSIPEKVFEGNILAISPRISETSRNILVRGIIDNKDSSLRPGTMLKVSIHVEDRDAIEIPERAISTIGEKHYVYVVPKSSLNKDNSAVVNRRYVTIGERIKGKVEIKKGITVGEIVAVDGIGKLSDSSTVRISNRDKL